MLANRKVTYHVLYCGQHCTGRRCFWFANLPYLNYCTHMLPQCAQCLCFRSLDLAIPLKMRDSTHNLSISYGMDSACGAVFVCKAKNAYTLTFDGLPLVP